MNFLSNMLEKFQGLKSQTDEIHGNHLFFKLSKVN